MSEKYNVVNVDRHDNVLYGTTDPTNPLGTPSDTPALTVLLHKVCDGDAGKFEEALRLIGLFLDKKGEYDAAPLKKLERLMGYVQNGTDGIVSLFQDDVTKDYSISHRAPGRDRSYYDWVVCDKSLAGAINKAYNEHKDDCE